MKLYVLRHGISLNLSEAKVSTDAERPLAETGREDIRAIARHLLNQGASVEVIFCSPLRRARETAEEAATILKPNKGITVFEPLSNKIPGSALFDCVQKIATKMSELLLVGHQPQLGEMVAHVLGSSPDIRPGGLVALEIGNDGKAVLLWHKNP